MSEARLSYLGALDNRMVVHCMFVPVTERLDVQLLVSCLAWDAGERHFLVQKSLLSAYLASRMSVLGFHKFVLGAVTLFRLITLLSAVGDPVLFFELQSRLAIHVGTSFCLLFELGPPLVVVVGRSQTLGEFSGVD